jgi:hypothetical protein
MDNLALSQAYTIAASLLGGLSVLLITLAVLPAIGRRETMLRRLQTVVETAEQTNDAPRPAARPRRFAWSAWTSAQSRLTNLAKRSAR